MLFDVSDVSTEILKRNKLYAVPCLYTTFKKIFSNGATVETTGEIFEKLKLAVEYNSSAPPTKGEATTIQKRLPNLSNALSKNQRPSGIVGYKSLDNSEKTFSAVTKSPDIN